LFQKLTARKIGFLFPESIFTLVFLQITSDRIAKCLCLKTKKSKKIAFALSIWQSKGRALRRRALIERAEFPAHVIAGFSATVTSLNNFKGRAYSRLSKAQTTSQTWPNRLLWSLLNYDIAQANRRK
jgi:hypothetical protein